MAGATIPFVLLCSALVLVSSQNSSMEQKCSQEFTKVTSCLDYATAKASAPSSSCCTAVTEIRNTDAVCLCYIIQQTHAGSSSVESLGLQFDRLLQLPNALHKDKGGHRAAQASIANWILMPGLFGPLLVSCTKVHRGRAKRRAETVMRQEAAGLVLERSLLKAPDKVEDSTYPGRH